MSERRFTDQEVAKVLQRASSLEVETGETPRARGLTLTDLKEIAGEVGIAPGLVDRAVAELASTRLSAPRGLLGPPGVAKAIHALGGPVDRERTLEMIRVVDGAAELQGTVTEALGEVRWTGRDRFHSAQVAVSPEADETVLRVEERFVPRVRRIATLLPTAWGAMLGVGLGGPAGLLGLPLLAAAVAGGAVGFGVGRVFWRALCARSQARVDALMQRLVQRAGTLPAGRSDSSGAEDS